MRLRPQTHHPEKSFKSIIPSSGVAYAPQNVCAPFAEKFTEVYVNQKPVFPVTRKSGI